MSSPPEPKQDLTALSRALGAAFLTHQVEQLERTVQATQQQQQHINHWRHNNAVPNHHNSNNSNSNRAPRARGGASNNPNRRSRESRRSRDEPLTFSSANNALEPPKKREKDADVIIADASTLIYSLSALKRWAREGSSEVVVVPLEALNTLDALKKGPSLPARLARNASRWLESVVGTNDRVMVQGDDDYVAWGELVSQAQVKPGEEIKDEEKLEQEEKEKEKTEPPPDPSKAPEWLRRMLCCAAFYLKPTSLTSVLKSKEAEEPKEEKTEAKEGESEDPKDKDKGESPKKVLLAISSPPVLNPPIPITGIQDRASGSLLTRFSAYFKVPTLVITPDPPPPVSHPHPHPRGERNDRDRGERVERENTREVIVEKPPAVHLLSKEGVQVRSNGTNKLGNGRVPGGLQKKEEDKEVKVIRLLTRGTKLEPES